MNDLENSLYFLNRGTPNLCNGSNRFLPIAQFGIKCQVDKKKLLFPAVQALKGLRIGLICYIVQKY